MYSGDVVVKRKRMMWHEDLPNARWFLLHLLDVIEIEIRKRECSDKHVTEPNRSITFTRRLRMMMISEHLEELRAMSK